MLCGNCGKEMGNSTAFCPHCGALNSAGPSRGAAAPSGQGGPAYTAPNVKDNSWSSPPPPKKKRGGALLIGGVAAAVVLLVAVGLAIAYFSGLFASPKGQVEKALVKSQSAYTQAREKMGFPDLTELTRDKSYSQRLSVELDSVNEELTGWTGASAFKGFGLSASADYDQKGRKMDLDIAAFGKDGGELASFQMLVDDNVMSFASPQFTKGKAYGVNTQTVGADLAKLGASDDTVDIEKIGFNLFDLVEKLSPTEEQTKEMKETMTEAGKKLVQAMEVKKEGKKSIQVNGKSTDAVLYHVVIPKSAMKEYVNALEDAMKTVNSKDVMEDVLRSMGFDKSAIDQIMSQANTTDVYGQMTDALKEAVKAIGDVELDVYLSGGYVCAVEYSGRIEGNKVSAKLYLGGGDNYVDNLSMEITVDGEKLTIESAGNHAGKDGVFTDETTIRTDSNRITSELRYEPKGSGNNFEWDLKLDSTASVSMEGQLTTTDNAVSLELDDLSISAVGNKILSLGAKYYLGPCDGIRVSMDTPKLLGDMSTADLMDLSNDIEKNAQQWVFDVITKLPPELISALL